MLLDPSVSQEKTKPEFLWVNNIWVSIWANCEDVSWTSRIWWIQFWTSKSQFLKNATTGVWKIKKKIYYQTANQWFIRFLSLLQRVSDPLPIVTETDATHLIHMNYHKVLTRCQHNPQHRETMTSDQIHITSILHFQYEETRKVIVLNQQFAWIWWNKSNKLYRIFGVFHWNSGKAW